MVPVLGEPVMAHILRLLAQHGFEDVIANLHYFPDIMRERFGDGSDYGVRLDYSFEQELLGTAGGVRNVRDFFGDETFLIISGDALTDIDLAALWARHKEAGGIGTLALKRVDDPSQLGVVILGEDGRIQGFPGEARSRRGAVGPRQLRHLRLRAGDLRLLSRAAVRRLGAGRLSGAAGAGRAASTATDRRVLERRRLAGGVPPGQLRCAGGKGARRAARVGDSGRPEGGGLDSAGGTGIDGAAGVHRRGLRDRGRTCA